MAAACVHVMELEEGLRLAYEDFLQKITFVDNTHYSAFT